MRKRVDIYTVVARLVRKVCEPPPVGRKHRASFMEGSLEEYLWFSRSKTRSRALHRQYPDVCSRSRGYFHKRQLLTIGSKGLWILSITALSQGLRLTDSVSAGPEHTVCASKDQVLAVCR